MRRSTKLALASVSLAALAFAASPASAQAQNKVPPPCPVNGEGRPNDNCLSGEVETKSGVDIKQTPDSTIVVTGTRINRPTLSSTVPITSIAPQDLASQGNVSLGDKLAELPQIRETFTQANSTRSIGTAGINALDLRGLGTSRTLVLVNGRRVVTATPGVNRPDVNSIPTDLVDRVDIITGGASAVYGSDAVAGVVNFILKRNFDGLRMNGQSGISSRGDRGSYSLSLLAGKNFAGGRGNVALAAEYAKQNTLFNTDRDGQTGAYSGRNQFNLVENTGPNLNRSAGPLHGAEPSTGNGIPDTAFLNGIRNNNISEGGLFTASCPTAAAKGETAVAFANRQQAACSGLANPGSSNPAAQFGRTFVFTSDGSLIANPCTTDLRPFGSSNCVGGLGSTLRLTGFLEPGLTRKAVNLLAHFDISDAVVPFIEAKYVSVDANQEGQPTFFNNSFSINNPFLTPQAKAQIQSVLAPGATTFTAQRFNIDFGGRGELHKRKNFQLVGGVTGKFNGDWKYEVSVNYGHLYTFYKTQGNLLRQNYANAINAVRNSSGQIVCGINADSNPTNDDPNCVPINLFGNGAPSQASLNYIGYTSSRVQKADLYDGIAYVSGDTSQLFKLPGGPIGFVLGAEARRETAFAAYDPITSSSACGVSGCTFLNTIPNFKPPAQVVKELFGELNIPILKDIPFARELSIDAAGRYSHYNIGKTGGVFAWNVNGFYAPIRDIRFRAGIARSVRAPTQSDLFSPPTQTFINGLVDPCGQQNINNGPIVNGASVRIANCKAAGVPTTQTFNGTTEPFTNRPASGISASNQGNPILEAEKGTSFTAGVVVQPSFIPGFSLTVDYYRIKVKNVIFSLSGQTLINQCYDNAGGINTQFCSALFRNPNGTFAGQSNVLHAGGTVSLVPTGPSALIQSFNFAKLVTNGIDFDLAYRKQFQNMKLTLRGIASRTITKNSFSVPTDPTFADRILGELGDPKLQAQFSANAEVSKFNLGYRVRYVGKQTIGNYETQHSFQGRPPTDPDAFPVVNYPSLWFHDIRLDIKPNNRFRFYTGVDNVFDRLPPLDLLGTESGAPSPVGRFFYAGAQVDF